MFDEFDPPESGIFRGFAPDTFAFLAELPANNNREWMLANAARYKSVLREPLRGLFQALGPVMMRLNPHLETEAKFGRVLAGIKKRWPAADGPYHTYLWGAFYRADHTKQTDAQLFVTLHAEGLAVGLGVGKGAQDILARLRRNIATQPDSFFRAMVPLLAENVVAVGSDQQRRTIAEPGDITDLIDQLKQPDAGFVSLERQYPHSDELLYRPELADEISRLFEKLYPVYRFAISEDVAAETVIPAILDPTAHSTARYSRDQLLADTLLPTAFVERLESLLLDKGQVILYGPPGTGKTFVARCFARYFADQHEKADRGESPGTVQIVQFHPSYAYEEFIEGIRPHSDNGQLTYPIEPGLFYRLCEDARRCPSRRYVLIVDEINRGNLPRVFGELLYALEYREELPVLLPYSKQPFTIPHNVYLIGTMNTADRSVAQIDHALRRRFHFVPLRPDAEILRRWLHARANDRMLWVADLMTALNRRLEADQIDWTLHIGQTHWMVRDLDEDRAALIWEHSILPTLEEYFYDRTDWLVRYDYEALKASVMPVK